MANSGVDDFTINTLERAESSDVNGLQAAQAQAMLDIWYSMYGVERSTSGAGVPYWTTRELPVTAIPSAGPLRATVLNGLLVNPQATHLLVDAGLLVAVVPSGDSADSLMTLARTDGVTSSLALPFVTNAGSAPRWDLVECRPRVTVTTATRDIFNPTTQTFTDTSVNKFTVTDLEFQYNVGALASPAANPVVTPGWQPVCAVWVPQTATSFDDCELFDTRPVSWEMTNPTGGMQDSNVANFHRAVTVNLNAANNASDVYNYTGALQIRGLVAGQYDWEVASGSPQAVPKLYNADCPIQATNPGTTLIGSAPSLTDGWSTSGTAGDYSTSGTTLTTDSWYQVAIMFPFGLARFKKYSNDTAQDGRRWPILMPGLIVIQGSNGDHTGQTSGAGMPLAYDTDPTEGWPAIVIGQVHADASASPLTFDSMAVTPDGWATGTWADGFQSATSIITDTASWDIVFGGTNIFPVESTNYQLGFEFDATAATGNYASIRTASAQVIGASTKILTESFSAVGQHLNLQKLSFIPHYITGSTTPEIVFQLAGSNITAASAVVYVQGYNVYGAP